MPLRPDEKAKLALWLCGARHLDPECYPLEDPRILAQVVAARGVIDAGVASAELQVTSGQEVAPYLTAVARKIVAVAPKANGARKRVPPALRDAERLLLECANHVVAADTGDGPALNGSHGLPCRCGLLDLAANIEIRIRRLLEAEVSLSVSGEPQVAYVTALTEDGGDFFPFRVDGKASIRLSPRTVTLVLKAESITARDLWHIAYTLHHELICHIFQGAFSKGALSDAHPACHWSEGWMDTLAFDLVTEWEGAPRLWLPLGGENAKGELRRFHDSRYLKPPRLKRDDIQRRQLARQAYRRLGEVLAQNEIVPTQAEAREIVRRFSLVANAHELAETKRLRALGTKLRQMLLNASRPKAAIAAARACFAFTLDHNFLKLEQALEAETA